MAPACLDCRRFTKASIAVFIGFNVLEFLVHGLALRGVYHHPGYMILWNPESVMNGRRWLALLAYAVMSWVLVRVYAQGYEAEKAPLEQGLRCGALMGVFFAVYHASVDYMIYPVGLKLALTWIAAGVLEMTILGGLASAFYRPEQDRSQPR
jgi:hypothetical protein